MRNKESFIGFWVTRKDKIQLEKLAKERDRSLSSYLRLIALRNMPEKLDELAERIREA